MQVANVLEANYDRRMTDIENLAKPQLVTECLLHNINHTGLKSELISRLQELLGYDYKVTKLSSSSNLTML